MKFTYIAPNEYNDLTSGFRTVESEYTGPHDFKVHIDPVTRKITKGIEYDHDGCPHCHGGSDNSPDDAEMVYLHAHNPNHIVLMAMLTNCEDHVAVNQVEVVCERYNMVYQRHEPPTLDHTYDLKGVTIDERGVVTYPWYKLDWSWAQLVAQGKSHKNTIRERQRVDILTNEEKAKADYCCEIIDYIIVNEISMQHPHKVAWPDIHTITLDNSMPIGLPDGIPNSDRLMEKTPAWGIVPHDHCCHIEGEDYVLEAVCPTPEEAPGINASEIESWQVTPEHPTHSAKCKHYHECDDVLCNDVGGDVEVTFEEILQKHTEEWEQLKSSN